MLFKFSTIAALHQQVLNSKETIGNKKLIVSGVQNLGNLFNTPPITRLSTEDRAEEGEVLTITDLDVAPNPFRTNTSIRFNLQQAEHVKLEIYNLYGEKVGQMVDQHLRKAQYNFDWEGRTDNGQLLDSGVYLIRLEIGEKYLTRKVSLLR